MKNNSNLINQEPTFVVQGGLKALIIDDEPDCVKLLALQLKMYCPQVQVVAECTESEVAYMKIKELQPDLVFMDIEMPVMNGFQLVEKIGTINFSLVFLTAYDTFAVKAFRFSALDYLLKPNDGKDLKAAVERAEQRHWTQTQQLNLLKQQLYEGDKKLPEKIALPYQNGVTFAEIKNVIYCEWDNNYTRIHTVDGGQYMVAKRLGDIREVLEERSFMHSPPVSYQP